MKRCSLKTAVAFYLEGRRRQGFALRSEGILLKNLVEHAQELGHRGHLTTELVLNWAQLPPAGSPLRASRLGAARRFALFWAVFDSRTQIPPGGLFGSAYRRASVYIYTPQEIALLLKAAHQLSPSQSLRARALPTLLGLLACTGLRISEALGLLLQDWDRTQRVLTVRRSKFGQSRYIPLSKSAASAFDGYLKFRGKAKCNTAAVFLDEQGKGLRYGQVAYLFAALRDQLGWGDKKPRPRLHDLRHTFAVNCLLGWYRQGQEELNAKILSLAVYLGHRSIQHTYWYVSAVPELLALGNARWAKALEAEQEAADA